MIKYSLICDTDHGFEAWFKNSDAFKHQLESGILSCPTCGSESIRKALMAPSVRSTGGWEIPPEPQAEILPPEQTPASPERTRQIQMMTKAAELKRQLLALRRAVEDNCDYVGDRFAKTARAIHDGEEEAKGIYGEATPNEIEALQDDGIEIGQIPWIKQDS
ncbi:MAG: DUF1178 family protein [Alphaproteobacteria bacterium]|nr:DUF1178 family protein [Alphaproteobacteria bacterium]